MAARDHNLVLFVSTGRCGTQWLADNLAAIYGDLTVIEHEPLAADYRCKRFFRCFEDPYVMLEVPEIARHVDHIDQVLEDRAYVETGWPVFSAIPLFAAVFGRRLKLVHLTRHPVHSAISHMVHKTYSGSPRVDGYTTQAALDPWSGGVVQADLASRWDALSPYEKTLFWWTEVHLYAEELQGRYADVPFHRIRSEDLFADDAALVDLTRFIGLPWRSELAARRGVVADRWHHRTTDDYDWRSIERHPKAIALAQRLGYAVFDVDEGALDSRYAARRGARSSNA